MDNLTKLSKQELIVIILEQAKVIGELKIQLGLLQEQVKSLQGKLNKDSHNSSKPPSSDGFKKQRIKSARKKTGRKPGGQKGHPGHTLFFVEEPENVLLHELNRCCNCDFDLENVDIEGYQKRQVFDLPSIKLETTEHNSQIKICPCCKKKQRASFPDNVSSYVQYGPKFKSLVIYLNQYQLVPYDRVCELIKDLTGHLMSEGTVYNILKQGFQSGEVIENQIKQQVLQAPVMHADETGIEINKDSDWLHVYSNNRYTYLANHTKRGSEAMNDIDMLPRYRGTVVHDGLAAYLNYINCGHALCNAHLLRDLTYLFEEEGHVWAKNMHALLLEMKKAVDVSKSLGIKLKSKKIQGFEVLFDAILEKGNMANPPPTKKAKSRGRPKQTKSRNLLDRFILNKSSILGFLRDPKIPFDNNQAERDIRMTKVKQKISGTFRSQDGANIFCRIRGFISTVKKQCRPVLESIEEVLQGTFSLFSH